MMDLGELIQRWSSFEISMAQVTRVLRTPTFGHGGDGSLHGDGN